jgi:hypothetical protein
MAVIINASTSTGLVQSADTSGIIQFQSNGSTKATLNSSGFSYPGAVLQVVQSLIAGKASTTSTSLTKLVTSASITPLFSTSKILVSVFTPLGNESTGNADFAIVRTVSASDTNVTGTVFNRQAATPAYGQPSWAWSLLDSPATTSAITYSVSAIRTDGSATPFCGGRATDGGYNTGTIFILQEIAA